MKTYNSMTLSDAIAFYYEKHHALRQGDMTRLLEMKQQCPELFEKINDTEIRDIIDYAKMFQATDRYKQLKRLEVKKQCSVINNDDK